MQIQTFSVLTGSEACNARCPFCISKMTPPNGVQLAEPEVDWRNFEIACRFAVRCGVTTVMLTGKGEPTLFPEQITRTLRKLQEFGFPFLEIQSNGIIIADRPEEYARHLQDWYAAGLTTIAISIVHYRAEMNQPIYLPHRREYIDLPALIRLLHGNRLSVRLTGILADGLIDSREGIRELIAFARENQVEQLTVRPVNRPSSSRNAEVFEWTNRHFLRPEQMEDIRSYLEQEGSLLMTLVHGAQVYDVGGQNICLTDSLTIDKRSDNLRQLIFFPDGHLRYDWQYQGAILL